MLCRHRHCPARRKKGEVGAGGTRSSRQRATRGLCVPNQTQNVFPSLPSPCSGGGWFVGDEGERRKPRHRAQSLLAPAIIDTTFLSDEQPCFQPARPLSWKTPAGGCDPAGSERLLASRAGESRPSQVSWEEEEEKEEGCSRTRHLQAAALLTGEGEEEQEGLGRTRRVVREGTGISPFSPHLGGAGQWKRKEKWVAERSGKKQQREVWRLARAGSTRAGTSKVWPCPQALCSWRCQPQSGQGANLQPRCCVSTGRAEALAEENASCSPSHPSHKLLLFLSAASLPARAPGPGALSGYQTSPFQALPSTDLSCCFLQGWTGSRAAFHEPLICISPELTTSRAMRPCVPRSEAGAGFVWPPPAPGQSSPPLTKAIHVAGRRAIQLANFGHGDLQDSLQHPSE